MASIDPTADQIEQIIADVGTKTGPIRMINLLKFREQADYGDATDPAEDRASTGLRPTRATGRWPWPRYRTSVGHSSMPALQI
jgi:hypothetical protein